ncbi:MAG: helix-turn-helix transcriptional regulator [Kiritimatiellae bacterium]|nr:helix-turn-helix transcriptional regulator [Kiritimatiellia bacterium]
MKKQERTILSDTHEKGSVGRRKAAGPVPADRREYDGTGFCYTLTLIAGKYKAPILYALVVHGTIRYNELRRYLGRVSFKTLTDALKALERDGLVRRKVYPVIPPKVEYSLTPRGASLAPILETLCDWGEAHRDERGA